MDIIVFSMRFGVVLVLGVGIGVALLLEEWCRDLSLKKLKAKSGM